jgi:hypothetical protein
MKKICTKASCDASKWLSWENKECQTFICPYSPRTYFRCNTPHWVYSHRWPSSSHTCSSGPLSPWSGITLALFWPGRPQQKYSVESIHLKHREYVFKYQEKHVHRVFINKVQTLRNLNGKSGFVGDSIQTRHLSSWRMKSCRLFISPGNVMYFSHDTIGSPTTWYCRSCVGILSITWVVWQAA